MTILVCTEEAINILYSRSEQITSVQTEVANDRDDFCIFEMKLS